MPDLPRISVFVSSPSDVMPEREIVERVVARLDGIWGVHVRLGVKRWERDHYEAVRSFQESIGEMAAFDIVLGILWKRLGSPLPHDRFHRADGSSYESGTVFELETAIACSEKHGRPAAYVFRKTEPVTFTERGVDEERPQREALKTWWNRTFRDEQGHFLRGYQEYSNLDELEPRLEDLLERYLREKGLIPAGLAWDIEAKGSPYPGLLPYEGAYSAVFFGRTLAIAAAMEDLRAAALRETPVLLIVGPSGSGKSSLARAGLAPHFSGTQIDGVDFWRKLLIEPAQDPFLALAQRLYVADALPELAASPQPTPEDFATLARQSPDGAARTLKWGLERAAIAEQSQIGGGRLPVGRLLLVLDQLETLLDSGHHQELSRFVRALVESETTWVIGTLRTDRYADLQLNPDLLELRRRGTMYDLPPPGPSEIADIIKGPARAAGLEFEEIDGQSLAKVINAAVIGADALPLLQMTLARLFDARDGRKLTFAAYDAMGGLEGAIAAHAEAVFDTVSPEGQAMLDALLRALVAGIDGNGRLTIRTPERAAITGDDASRELVDKLTEARLLVNADGGVRIAHEALLRRWQRATASPALQPEAIRLRRQIEPNFEVWQRTSLENDLLQAGTTAIAASETIVRTHPGAFPPDLEAYVSRSVAVSEARARAKQAHAEADARRARRRAYAAIVAATAFAGLALIAFVIYVKARDNLSLALLTKADQYLYDERPTQALVLANAALASNFLPQSLARLADRNSKRNSDVLANTIMTIAGSASRTPIRTLTLPDGAEAKSVAFSRDGIRFAVGDQQGQITVAQTNRSGGEIYLRLNTEPIHTIRFSPDGRWIASASDENAVKLWNLQTNDVKELCGHHGRVYDLAFDPSGRFLASASNDGHVIVWDMRKSDKVAADLDLTGSGDDGLVYALAVAFTHDGTALVSSDDHGNVYIHNTADWSRRRIISTGRTDLISLSISPTDRRIATASSEGPLDVWDADSGQHIASIAEYQNKLKRVRFSPDGRLLAAATWDGLVRLWNAKPVVEPGAKEHVFPYAGTINGNDNWINDIAFTNDSVVLATAGQAGAVRLWSLRNLQPMFYTMQDDSHETLSGGAYSPDGSKFVAGGKDGFANLYDVDDIGRLNFRCQVKHEGWVYPEAFSGDSKWVVSAGTVEGRVNNVIRIWQSNDCQGERSIDVGHDFVQAVSFNARGDEVAWSTFDGKIRLADLGRQIRVIPFASLHKGEIWTVNFSPDGKLLVSAGLDPDVVVWNVQKRAVARVFQGHRKAVTFAAFAPDGNLIASAGEDDNVLIWDLRKPEDVPVARLYVRGGASGFPVFSANGKVLAIDADARFISIWSLQDFKKLFELDSLVGERGVFGFQVKRGDMAFDGENGVVRIIPRLLPHLLDENSIQRTSARDLNAVLRGTDVFFDEIRTNVVHPTEVNVTHYDTGRCESAQ